MQLNEAQVKALQAAGFTLEQIAAQMSGTAIGSNGKAKSSKPKAEGAADVTAVSPEGYKPKQAVARTTDVPAFAIKVEMPDGQEFAAFVENVQGIRKNGRNAGRSYDTDKVKVPQLGWGGSFSINVARYMATEEFRYMMAQVVETWGLGEIKA